ncbi:hypothetical protein DEI90_08830 [Curtobacterium sp. MCBD17_031]|nr:hypothetical protein DEI90_08830 [Curtobacterium sp. MCBD17_031]
MSFVRSMISGASDEALMPSRTTWSTPSSCSSDLSAATCSTSGRDAETASTQPRRRDASDSASGPHSGPTSTVMPEAT